MQRSVHRCTAVVYLAVFQRFNRLVSRVLCDRGHLRVDTLIPLTKMKRHTSQSLHKQSAVVSSLGLATATFGPHDKDPFLGPALQTQALNDIGKQSACNTMPRVHDQYGHSICADAALP